MKTRIGATLSIIACMTIGLSGCVDDNSFILEEFLTAKDNPEVPVNLMKQTVTLPNTSVGLEFVIVKAGSFMMGADEDDEQAYDYEGPAHHVTLTRDFAISTVTVTQELFDSVMKYNPSEFAYGGNYPVENVTYEEATAFCYYFSLRTGKSIHLPTEAQWEYAARGGHAMRRAQTLYSGSDTIDSVAWIRGSVVTFSDGTSADVTMPQIGGYKMGNALDIYDMTGNVWEWCDGFYYDYPKEDQTDPQTVVGMDFHVNPNLAVNQEFRVVRGGAYNEGKKRCRLSYRWPLNITDPLFSTSGNIGFRVVMDL